MAMQKAIGVVTRPLPPVLWCCGLAQKHPVEAMLEACMASTLWMRHGRGRS